MEKIKTLACALLTALTLAPSAKAQTPVVSTDDETYTYYLYGAGLTKGWYAQNTVGTGDEVQWFNDKTKRLKVKLVASDNGQYLVATNLGDGVDKTYIGCTGTAKNATVKFYTEADKTNAEWVIAQGQVKESDYAKMKGYYPYYTITAYASTAATTSWNMLGGLNNVTAAKSMGLWDNNEQGSMWNFVPADLATLKNYASTLNLSVSGSMGFYDQTKSDVLDATTAIKNATDETDVDNLAEDLLNKYTAFKKAYRVWEDKMRFHSSDKIGEPTLEAYQALMDCLEDVTDLTYDEIIGLETAYQSTCNMPEDGKIYQIYGKFDDDTKVYAVNGGKISTGSLEGTDYSQYYTSGAASNLNESVYWIFQKVGDHYQMASIKGDYLFTYLQGGKIVNGSEKRTAYTDIYIKRNNVIGNGALNLCPGDNTTNIAIKKDGSVLDQYTGNASNTGDWTTDWYFVEVDGVFDGHDVFMRKVSGEEQAYATVNLPYASIVPEGVTAHKVGSINDKEVTLTAYKQAGEVLPANTPVLLSSQTIANDGVKFMYTTYAAPEETGFKGTLAAAPVTDANAYILATKNEVFKFFSLDPNNNTVNANKAYLVLNNASQALKINFGGNATSINNVVSEANDAQAPIFDLSGRRVTNATKGVYIQNGKKYVK